MPTTPDKRGWSPKGVDDVFGHDNFMGFNFLEEGKVGPWMRLGRTILTLTFYLDGALRRLASKFWRVNASRGFSPHLFCYPREQRFLALRGTHGEYLALCKDLHVTPYSFHTAKAFHLLKQIQREFPEAPPRRVLELGPGPGVLATMLLKWNPAASVTLVDLPEVLPAAKKTLARLAPNADLTLATPEEAARLGDNMFDLALCIATFHLLTPRQIDEYLALVQRTVKPGGVFVSLVAPKGDNNPLLYPYRANRIVRWGPDEFHSNVLQWAPEDAYVLRVERIAKT